VAAIELNGRKVSERTFHRYLNPERDIDEGAAAVHGLTLDRLQDEPKFAEIAPALLEFIGDAELIIHNAPFRYGVFECRAGTSRACRLWKITVIDHTQGGQRASSGARKII